MRRGFKISLEGIDGAGKTTQLRHVVSHLQDSGFNPHDQAVQKQYK